MVELLILDGLPKDLSLCLSKLCLRLMSLIPVGADKEKQELQYKAKSIYYMGFD